MWEELMLLASVMTVPVRHGAVVTAGSHLEMSFPSLGMSDGHLKSWDLFFFFFKKRQWFMFKKPIPLARTGTQASSWGPDFKPGAWGPGGAADPMGALQGWSAKREAFAIQSQLWQKTGGDLGRPLASEREAAKGLWVCWQEGRVFPEGLVMVAGTSDGKFRDISACTRMLEHTC